MVSLWVAWAVYSILGVAWALHDPVLPDHPDGGESNTPLEIPLWPPRSR